MGRSAKTKYSDPRGRHTRLHHSLLNSHAWKALSHSARSLYVDLRMKLNSTNNGDISAAMADLKLRGWTSSATVSQALKELRAAGFIDVTRPGGFPARTPTLYRFTDEDTYEMRHKGIAAMKATNDFEKFQSIEQAKAVIKEGVHALTERNRGRQWSKSTGQKKSRVQLVNAMGSTTGSMMASNLEEEKEVRIQILNSKNRASSG